MVKEKIEDISTEILLKRKKFIVLLVGIYIGIMLTWIALIIYDIINGEISKSTTFGGVGAFALLWLPLYMLRKVNDELKRREEK